MKTRCIIVDDEPLAIEAIQMHVQKFGSLKLVATCEDAIQAFDVLRNESIDLVFLDIQMPEMTGLEFLKSLNNPPKVIFTTAYRDFAIQAFDLDVVDYLLKPISFNRFMQAVNKYFESTPKPIKNPSIQSGGVKPDEYFLVKADKKNVRIRFENVLYIEGLKDYVKVICKDKTIITKIMIGTLAKELPENYFMRIHRSFIVYIPNIEAYSSISVEVSGKELPVGRNYKHEVLSTLERQ